MASKKYLSLDEVSGQLGLSTDQINKLREEGRLRGFADRGTWKFKADDVEEFSRSRQADSAPDVPILADSIEDDSFVVSPSGISQGGRGSSVISSDDDDLAGDQPTVIRGDASGSSILDDEPLLASSDSDVRLILDDHLVGGDSSPDVTVQGDSDSDVRLIDEGSMSRSAGNRSDSDVKLVSDEGDTVSDVRLLSDDAVPIDKSGSDSDVALVSPSRKGGGSVFDDEDDLRSLAGDSGISLESIADSGIALDSPRSAGAGDSGISLDDSVLGGAGVGSSIVSLSEDSGIALSSDSVKGSGIQVGSPTDSGIALEALNEGGATQPMMNTYGRRGGERDTEFEMGSTGDSEFELASGDDVADGDDTSVILFDDEDSFDVQPVAKKPAAKRQPLVDEFDVSESGDVVELDEEFDAFDEGGSAVVMADDDDLEFEAADEDFDDGFQTGESAADFTPASQRVVVAPEPEFSVPTFAGLAATSALLVLCGLMMFDLVRSMWGYNEPVVSSWLLDSTKNLF